MVGGSSEEETGCRLDRNIARSRSNYYKYAVSIFQYAVPYALSLT